MLQCHDLAEALILARQPLIEPNSPIALSFDNPFPVFPTKKTKSKPDSKPAERANGDRSSDERSRPATAASGRCKENQRLHDALTRAHSEENSHAPIQGSAQGQRAMAQEHSQVQRPADDGAHYPWRAPSPAQPPPQGSSGQSRAPPPNGQAHPGGMPLRTQAAGPAPPQTAFNNASERAMSMPRNGAPNMNGPASYQGDEQWQEPGPTAGYHGPTSPAYIPPHLSANTSARSSPNGLLVQHHKQHDRPSEQQASVQERQARVRHESLGDFYDNYYENHEQWNGVSSAMNERQHGLEEEMPNFDAQPVQRPDYRRGYTMDQHLPPAPTSALLPIPTMTQDSSNQGYDYIPKQSFEYHRPVQRNQFQPDFGIQQQSYQTNDDGFVFEMPGDVPDHILPVAGTISTPMPPQIAYGQKPSRTSPSPGIHTDRQAQTMQPYGHQPPMQLSGQPPVNHQFHRPGVPPMYRGLTTQTARSDPGPGAGTAIASVMQTQSGPPPNAVAQNPLVQLNERTNPPAGRRSNPDALPHHPVPVRPGLMEEPSPPQPAKPPPVRQYNTGPSPGQTNVAAPSAVEARPSSDKRLSAPVTHAELNQLRQAIKSNSQDYKTQFRLAKKLVEAASVLSSDSGRASPKTLAKNREKYIFEAHKLIKKLVSNSYAPAMFYLADCYGQGLLGLAPDTKEAFTLYQSAAKLGHPASAYRTAVCCELGADAGGGTRKDPLKAVQWYKRAAALGDVAAMYKMGMVLLKGLLGQQRNEGEAVIWLKRAAERADAENPHALHELGLLYEGAPVGGNGRLNRDEGEALRLFEQAARLGYRFSQFRLGQAFEYGMLGCPIDARKSIAWYTRAAAQGEHQAELALSGWYLTGSQGILEQSDTEAYLWARKAASADPPLPKALFAMGYFTEVGIGCPRSLEEAKRWYGRAAGEFDPCPWTHVISLEREG